MTRNQEIVRTSVVGVLANLVLSAFKMAVGIAANSVSIRADAINNTSDALSSIITIIGTRLSEREPDRAHPFGYGRIEYLTSLLIGLTIIYAGVTEVLESGKRILHPEPNDYSAKSLLIVAAAIVVKIGLGLYTMRQGKRLDSVALHASGHDALDDSIASTATLVAALIFISTGVSVEAYIGLGISLLVLKTGIETLRETVSSLLGERVDLELASAVKRSILSFPEVEGVFDLAIHNYGKEKLIGSAHIEVPDVLKASWIDNLQRAITKRVLAETGVEMLGITIYAVNSRDREAVDLRETVSALCREEPSVTGVHGFYLDKVDKAISLNVEADYSCRDMAALRESLTATIRERYPEFDINLSVRHNVDD